jgi:hypothetical protein
MTNQLSEHNEEWVAAVQHAIATHLHQIPYGNLRTDCTTWDGPDGLVTNLAIVYEVPGGSTNQLNISYCSSTGMYSYIKLDSHQECCSGSLDEVCEMVSQAVDLIPGIRHRRLAEDIDRWAASGMGQRELFQHLTTLLAMDDLRGGAITMAEMKDGITYILRKYRPTSVNQY